MSSNKNQKKYCKLSSITHLKQYLNIVGVIDAITPKISHLNKTVKSMDLELADETLHNPGFVVRLIFEGEPMNQFMDVCSKGLVLEVLEMKIVKNEGVVYGEVTDAEDIKLYSDKAVQIPWNPSDRILSVPDNLKSIIEKVYAWKMQYFGIICESEENSGKRRLKHSYESTDSTISNQGKRKRFKINNLRLRERPKINYTKILNSSESSSESDSNISSSQSGKRKLRKRPKSHLNSDDSNSSDDNSVLSKTTNVGSTSTSDPKTKTDPSEHGDKSACKNLQKSDTKKTRSSPNNYSKALSNTTTKNNALDTAMSCLNRLARKSDVEGAQSIADVSICELYQVECCEKFDLECKVVSEKQLFDDGIQIVRVQDGTVRPGRTLLLPEASSWSEITNKIENDPISCLKINSPVIDIVILDFTRLDNNIKSGNFYSISNTMGIPLHLKGHKFTQADLFFYVEGQNAYPRKISQAPAHEITEKLNTLEYKRCWREMFGTSTVSNSCTKDAQSDTTLESEKTKCVNEKTKSNNEKSKSLNKNTTLTSSRQLEEKESPQLQKKQITNSTQKAKESSSGSKKLKHDQEISNKTSSVDENVKNNNCKQNIFNSEVPFEPGETPTLYRELAEIMNEESDVGLPQSQSEDVHLKNSGSEVQYLEFLKNADKKSKTFRTSTQETSACGRTFQEIPKMITVDDSSEMGSLKYPASSANEQSEEIPKMITVDDSSEMGSLKYPASSANEQSGKTSRELCDANEMSVSVIQSYEQSSANAKKDTHTEKSRKTLNNIIKTDKMDQDDSDSSCLSLISYQEKFNHSINNKSNNGIKWYNIESNLLDVADHCFFKSKTPLDKREKKQPDEREIGPIEKLCRQYGSEDSSNHDAPFIPLKTVWKMANKNTLKVYVWFSGITPKSGSWKYGIKSKCSSCGNSYDILTVQNRLCPESQCCCKILESPEFHFSLDLKVSSGSSGKTLTAFATGKEAEILFGCTAEQALKNRKEQNKVIEVLQKIESCIKNNNRSKVIFTRKNIACAKSGPLLIQKIY